MYCGPWRRVGYKHTNSGHRRGLTYLRGAPKHTKYVTRQRSGILNWIMWYPRVLYKDLSSLFTRASSFFLYRSQNLPKGDFLRGVKHTIHFLPRLRPKGLTESTK